MAIANYYSSLSDVNLAKDAVAKNSDLYIQKYEYIGTAVLDTSVTGANVLTMTGVSFVVDELISTMAKNLVVLDDNGIPAQVEIDDNDATTVTFDEANLLIDSDGVTAATLTDTSTYNIYVLTPSPDSVFGPFFGYTEGLELNISDELMQFKYNMPKKLKFQDLSERTAELVGGNVDISNEDVLTTIFGAEQYGDQTTGFKIGIGSDPDLNIYYRLTKLTEDREGRQIAMIMRKCQVSVTGSLDGSAESGHKMSNFKFDLTSDGFYPDNVDMIQINRA